MSNKTVRLMVRVTPELKQKLDDYVATVPGGRGDVIRDALERYLHIKDLEQQMKQASGMQAPP
jgi:metal-responsive CopG/Arc/MetJ family transcriptional regulator